MPDPSSHMDLLDQLAEEFAQRHERGERPTIEEYAARYPHLAAEIRDLFPALVLMQNVRPEPGNATGPFEPHTESGDRIPRRLGDYRILREVGRGGMGIVYEAEQESLGRHVALKLLPSHALLDSQRLRRFQREARAAARLHHTNIVPVYGVGSHEGVHYYVMQFIQGLGLDEVLAELKQLRAARGSSVAARNNEKRSTGSGTVSAADVAQALLTGHYQGGAAEMPAVRPTHTVDPARPASGSDSAVHLPGQASISTISDSGQQYWQSVARIGTQVAEALAYAHAQGTLHRDIKPSNLLLDTQGTVWITDFGLAKAMDSEDLTHTGDIVGTLRYMAPERFQGQSDIRGDLYSLGLTLYELLTFRPAFEAADRNRLIQQIVHEEPLPPRRLNRDVPRDLETIVLKAIAREPSHRYQTATELADDLKRFVEYKPIHARRVRMPERFWRWCRRNPAVASLLGLLMVVFLAGFAGVTWKWREAEVLRKDEKDARDKADEARKDANARADQSNRELKALTDALRLSAGAQLEVEGARWQKAEEAYTEAVRLRPDLPYPWINRGDIYQSLCLWKLAGEDYARADARQETNGTHLWLQHAVNRLVGGDEPGYRRLCQRVVEAFPEVKETEVAHRIAMVCSLVPDPVVERQRLVKIAANLPPSGSAQAWHHWGLALAQYRAGNYELALRAAQKCEQVDPSYVKPCQYGLQAMIQHRLRQPEAARQALKKAEEAREDWVSFLLKQKAGELPSSAWNTPIGLWIATEAKAVVEGIAPPEDPRLWAIQGRGLAAIGRTDEAAAQFARAVAAKPRDAQIRLAHFRFFAEQGQWDKAESELKAAAAIRPDDVEPWMSGFKIYAQLGQRQRADAALEQAARTHPTYTPTWLAGFQVYAAEGNWEAARAAHAQAVARKPDDAKLRLHIFAYHAEREDWDKAESEYQRVAAERPDDPHVRNEYANYLVGKNRNYAQAAEALRQAVRIDPKSDGDWNLLGVCYFRGQEFDKAVKAFAEAINQKPKNSFYWSNRASAHAALGAWKEAADDYAKAVQLEPGNIQNRRHQAISCLWDEKTAEYRRICRQMLQMAKDSGVAGLVGPSANVCILAPKAFDDYAELLSLLERWEKGNETNEVYLSILGAANYRAGKYSLAREILERGLKNKKDAGIELELFLALTNHQIGDWGAARQGLTRAKLLLEEQEASLVGKQGDRNTGRFIMDRQPTLLLRREVEGVLNAPHRREVEDLLRNKEWAKALPLLDKLIEINPKFWPDLMSRGTCYAELGDLKKARDDYTKAVDLEQEGLRYTWLHHAYGLLCHAVDGPGVLRQRWTKIAERYGKEENAEVRHKLAVMSRHLDLGEDRKRVVSWLEKMTAQNPQNFSNQWELAINLFRAGRYNEALERFRKAEEVEGTGIAQDHIAFHDYFLAMVHHHLGHRAEARHHLERALAWTDRFDGCIIEPPDWNSGWNFRIEHQMLRRESEALFGPASATEIGECMRGQRWADAIRHLDQRLADQPQSDLDVLSRALCHVQLKQWTQAAADFGRLAELRPKDPWPMYQQAAALLGAGDREAFRHVTNQYLERFGNRYYLKMMMLVGYAAVRTPDAVTEPERLVRITERLQDNWATESRLLGAVLYRNGRWHEALHQFKERAKVGDIRAWDWLFLAMIHHRLGHVKEAQECLDKAKRWTAEANQHRIGWGTAWGWWGERIEVEELTREAEALLKQKPSS